MVGEVIEWPAELMRVASHSYFLRSFSREGTPDLSGRTQIVTTGDQIWSLQMTLAIDGDPARVRMFDSFVDQMNGMANVAEISVKDCLGYDSTVAPNQEPFSTRFYFSTGYGFAGDGTQPVIAGFSAAAGLKAITIASTPTIEPLRQGDLFSHNGFLHRVTNWTGGTITFLPALRGAVARGDQLFTDPPIVRMRFATDQEGRATRTINSHRGGLTLNFIEAFDR